VWWVLGIAAFLLLSVAFYPAFKEQTSFEDLFKDLPEGAQALFGAGGEISLTSPAGYLHSQIFTQVFPLALLIFGIGLGARAIAGAEGDGTLELLLANPVTRTRVAAERFVATAVMVIGLGAIMSVLLLAFSAPFELLEGISIPYLFGACAAATSLALLHTSIAFAVGAAAGGRARALSASAAVAVAGYILFGIVSSDVIPAARFITPWWWYLSRNIVAEGFPIESVWVPVGLSLVLGILGIWRFRLRDLH
jgi:ABC-2 type transport system permease protein